ncbi:tyrosinase [Hahella sp. CCB-MM4]|uniref:Tyrosinase HcTyr2 n=1 Tax=Hahella sp. (strain CCB-MM4) TaxID=1926491 RepID=TYR2_HAHS4|nr:tyrosinase family protein [Hahella sp. CCB-MM4]OZG75462.1 tyrosinase [Hahella sp. CCB-MM4]
MGDSSELNVRRSVRDLQAEYDRGNRKPLEDLIRAWKGIQELPPDDKRSFFILGGYHGEPFDYRNAVDALPPDDIYTYWGGWCNHGNVLFPTWHRIYILKLEEALQSIVPGVTLPFWDETSEETVKKGIPDVLTREYFELDGENIKNPLYSYTLPLSLSDNVPGDNKAYEKPAGYETVRYPLSGLVGTPEARAATAKHNAKYPNPIENTQLLNKNIIAWLHGSGKDEEGPTTTDPNPKGRGVKWMYEKCLSAPNYTVFSNTTSAGQWNLDHPAKSVVALEQPHNDVHLAVGGFDIPGQGESGQVADANGDMGENNTAALDPIFFFHHCNVDRMFWLWQKQNGFINKLEVITGYYGTNSSDSQGPTPGIPPGTPLDLNTPLNPFIKDEFGNPFTSMDCINIEEQLGYTYGPGSLDEVPKPEPITGGSTKKLTVRGINRGLFDGSFVIRAYASVPDAQGQLTEYYLGDHAVLSRRNVVKCANCLTHLEVIAHFPLDTLSADLVDKAEYWITIQHRGHSKRMKVDKDTGQSEKALLAQRAELPEKLKYSISVTD